MRKVFFSFHYERDIWRVNQVRNSWRIRGVNETQPFYDKAEFEQVKRQNNGIRNWIDEQLKGTSVTIVLFGTETSTREWVHYEITESIKRKNGILAIDIHNVKNLSGHTDYQGLNPLSLHKIHRSLLHGSVIETADKFYKTYDWVNENGYQNISNWIEAAAKQVGK